MLSIRSIAAGLLGLATLLTSAQAGQRRFAYSYETLTSPKGSIEFENWVTLKHTDQPGGDDGDKWEFRHEVEFGLTDHLQLGIYVADWSYDEDDSEGHQTRYNSSGAELIWNLSNPNTDLLGSALYGEVLVGEELVELEIKALLEKRFGPLSIAYNAILEIAWEGEHGRDETGEFAQTVGISYDVNKHVSIGVEAKHEIEMPDWEETEDGRFFVGPNVSLRAGRFFATAAALWQTTHIEGEEDVQGRLIVGFDF